LELKNWRRESEEGEIHSSKHGRYNCASKLLRIILAFKIGFIQTTKLKINYTDDNGKVYQNLTTSRHSSFYVQRFHLDLNFEAASNNEPVRRTLPPMLTSMGIPQNFYCCTTMFYLLFFMLLTVKKDDEKRKKKKRKSKALASLLLRFQG
jgi:hypothetical protein